MAEPAAAPLRIAANITTLFQRLAPLDRGRAAVAAGFDGIEVLFPYDHPPEAWAAALAGIPVALVNTPAGDWAAGQRGFGAVPGQRARFRAGFLRALAVARAVGAARIHVMAGIAAGPRARATFLRNLDWAAAQGHPLTVEPLNPIDMPGYFLNDFRMAAGLLAELGGAPGAGILRFAAGIAAAGYRGWIAGEYRERGTRAPGWPSRLRQLAGRPAA